MAFTPKNRPIPYTANVYPQLEGSERLYIETELRRLQNAILQLNKAVTEIQTHLESLP